MDYSFLPYDQVFKELFENEKSYLQKIIGDKVVIEHFGSTAVPGLGGKGVIDIYILAPKDKVKSVSNKLQKNGYLFKDFFKDTDHLFHQIDKVHSNKKYHYHIHLSPIGNKNFEDCIAFRDYLKIHPEAVKKYIELKQIALKKIQGMTNKEEIMATYLKTKSLIINEIIKNSKEIK